MKLELKHLAPYLPYGLRLKELKNEYPLEGSMLDTISIYPSLTEDIKPILRPLTDLTNEILQEIYKDKNLDIVRMKYQIVINYSLMGEWFKDVINLRQIFDIENSHLTMPTWLYIELIKMHFDMYFLIDNELAIDINTL